MLDHERIIHLMEKSSRDGTGADGFPPLHPGYFGKVAPRMQREHTLQIGYYCLIDPKTGKLIDGEPSRLREILTTREKLSTTMEERCDHV